MCTHCIRFSWLGCELQVFSRGFPCRTNRFHFHFTLVHHRLKLNLNNRSILNVFSTINVFELQVASNQHTRQTTIVAGSGPPFRRRMRTVLSCDRAPCQSLLHICFVLYPVPIHSRVCSAFIACMVFDSWET